jgi:hypothetical protein
MINNSTNIKKTKNNYLSPQLIEHEKMTTIYEIENLGSGLRQAQKYGRIKPVNGIPILPLLVTRSPTAIQI